MVESNGKSVSVKRNLLRKSAFQNSVYFFHDNSIKIKHMVIISYVGLVFAFLIIKGPFQKDKNRFDKILISIFVKLRVLLKLTFNSM